MTEHFDAIVIGAGQAGGPLSTALARSGQHTALIEREYVGGTCINRGCTPTKTMVANARVAYLARRAADYGVYTGDVRVDMRVVRQRKRDIVHDFRAGSLKQIEGTDGVELIRGEARFTDARTLEITLNAGSTRTISAPLIIINTGARPAVPAIDGIDAVAYLDSTSIMELDSVPDHLLVLGGGYIGLEYGQMFRRFGSNVTIVQRDDQLLAREDADIAQAVAEILREDGIEILLQAEAQRVHSANGGIALVVSTPDGERTLNGSHLLVAAGRTSNTDALDPVAAGVALDKRGHITVDARLRTNVEGIYAVGDVTGGPAFTHIAYDDFRILRTNLIDGGDATTADRQVPYTVFIDPQLGRIGLSEAEAREQKRAIKVATIPMSDVARALEVDEPRGLMKVIIDADTDQILGAAILGIEGGEIMAMLQIAMLGKLPYTVLRDAIFAHPTLAEAFNNLFASLEE